MRRLVWLIVFTLFMIGFVSGEPHPDFPAFGAPQSGFSVSDSGIVSANDDAVYKTGYYSTGGAWQVYSLSGSPFTGTSDWLTGNVNAQLSGLSAGNVYVISYSCSRVNNAWDCHGGQWQLQITELGVGSTTPTCDDGILNGDETGVDCGGSCSACVVVPCEDCTFEPEHLHLMWSESEQTDTSMDIIWEEPSGSPSSDTVYYTTSSNGCQLSNYPNTVQSTSNVFSGLGTRIHVAQLRNLQANTLYYFCIASGNDRSVEYSFRTAPSSGTDFTVIMGSDTQGRHSTLEFFDLTKEAMKEEPLFIIHAGDGAAYGDKSNWNNWLDAVENFVTPSGRLVPIIPSVGNHDLARDDDLMFWRALYSLPDNEIYFYHDVGDLRVLTLYLPEGDGLINEQVPFIENSLQEARSQGKWMIVQYHKPMYPSRYSLDSTMISIASDWGPIFDDYKPHLVVEGHDHIYKRTYPMYGGDRSNIHTGTIHIGGGGWPSSRTGFNDDTGMIEKYVYAPNVVIVELNSQSYNANDESTWMQARAIDEDGVQIDAINVPMKN